MYTEFRDWVKDFRVQGLHETQSQMAAWLGVHAFTVARWESGIARPHSSSLQAMEHRAEDIGFARPPQDVDKRLGPRA